jgi:hypothetical protein
MLSALFKYLHNKIVTAFFPVNVDYEHSRALVSKLPLLQQHNSNNMLSALDTAIIYPLKSPDILLGSYNSSYALQVISWNISNGLDINCKSNLENIIKYMNGKHPDIICFQSMPSNFIVAGTSIITPLEFIRQYLLRVYYISYRCVSYGNLAIFSKYPIQVSGEYVTPYHSMWADIVINGISFRIINLNISATIPISYTSFNGNSASSSLTLSYGNAGSTSNIYSYFVHDAYNDLLTQCYNKNPVIMCGKYKLQPSSESTCNNANYPSGIPMFTENHISLNNKWCDGKFTPVISYVDYACNTSLHHPVISIIQLKDI